MKTEEFNYELPERFIAQEPAKERDHSRLMVLDRQKDDLAHRRFFEIIDYLNPGDLLVVNDTRVIPARFYGRKLPGGGRVEVLLLNKLDELRWEALVGGSGMKAGRGFLIDQGPEGEVEEVLMAPAGS